MAVLEYAEIFSNILREMYGHDAKSDALYHTNEDLQIINGNKIKIPTLTVGGYKDHTRAAGYNSGNYQNGYDIKTLDHDRDIEFIVDPMDVDETDTVTSIANIQKRFEKTQAIPELDCYTFSKLYSEANRVGATIRSTVLNEQNILADFDDNLEKFSEAGVPLDRVIMYVTPAFNKTLKNADGIYRTLSVTSPGSIDRRIRSVDDIKEIIEVPSARFKTAYNFTDGCVPASAARQINYILIDPEAQVSRVKYSYIKVFEPGTDSRTADNYIYQNRRYNGTYGIDELLKDGCIINVEAEKSGTEGGGTNAGSEG